MNNPSMTERPGIRPSLTYCGLAMPYGDPEPNNARPSTGTMLTEKLTCFLPNFAAAAFNYIVHCT